MGAVPSSPVPGPGVIGTGLDKGGGWGVWGLN